MRYRTQVLILVASVAVICAATVAWLSYRASSRLMQETLKAQVRALASAAAAAIDVEKHESVRREPVETSTAYRELEAQLRGLRNLWREAGIPVKFVYTLAPDSRAASGWIYVIDAEEPGPGRSPPGTELNMADSEYEPSKVGRATAAYVRDEYGETLTGIAPVIGKDGNVVALVGVDLLLSSVEALNRSLALSGGAALIGAAILALIAGWFLAGRVTRPLVRLHGAARAMADGDLAQPVTAAGAREIDVLAASLESLRSTLRGIVSRIQELGICASESCSTLHDRTLAERDRASEAARNAVEAASRASDIASTARALADASTELRTTGNSVIAAGTEGIENLRGIAASVAQVRETSTALATQLQTLRERARAVDGLLEAMVSVADRSNLLSLNAEIEATKAGESGRGFMVVAGEIRRLAEQAAASALQIEANVRRMHEAVDEGVRATDRLVEALAHGTDRTRHGTDLLQSTVSGIDGLTPRVAGIADASVRQREGAEVISNALGGIAESATNALEFFESVDGILADFQRRGQEMTEAVRGFRL